MIRKYSKEDYEQVHSIVYRCWSEEIEMNVELKEFIYEFLTRHYLYNNDLTYVYDEDGVKAFALAHELKEKNDSIDFFKNEIKKLSKENQIKAREYYAYLEENEKHVIKYMNDKDVYFDLLASIKSHAGTKLIENLIFQAKSRGFSRIFFWTDETCNYTYYERKGFNKLEEYITNLFGVNLRTFVYVIKI